MAPRLPFWKDLEGHKLSVLALYRQMLRQAKLFSDDVQRTYLRAWIRERFRNSRRVTSPKIACKRIEEAKQFSRTMEKAINGDADKLNWISDLAYGRRGRIAMVIKLISNYKSQNKPCRHLTDMRPHTSIRHDPHPAYAIPFDQRVYKPPEHVLSITPETIRQQQLERAKANQIPPSELVVHRVITNYGYQFYRIKGRTQPHWLGKLIKVLTRQSDRRSKQLQGLEELLSDVKEEEQFLKRLGVEDSGGYIPAIQYEIERITRNIIQSKESNRVKHNVV
ncbi:hypothetical protein EV182_000799, partial [Spiromyces aspiralis]